MKFCTNKLHGNIVRLALVAPTPELGFKTRAWVWTKLSAHMEAEMESHKSSKIAIWGIPKSHGNVLHSTGPLPQATFF